MPPRSGLAAGRRPSDGEPVTADAFLHLAHDQLRVVRQRLDDGHRLLSVGQPPARHGVDRHLHYLHAQVARFDAAAEWLPTSAKILTMEIDDDDDGPRSAGLYRTHRTRAPSAVRPAAPVDPGGAPRRLSGPVLQDPHLQGR